MQAHVRHYFISIDVSSKANNIHVLNHDRDKTLDAKFPVPGLTLPKCSLLSLKKDHTDKYLGFVLDATGH